MQIEIVSGLVGGIPLKSEEKQFRRIFLQTVCLSTQYCGSCFYFIELPLKKKSSNLQNFLSGGHSIILQHLFMGICTFLTRSLYFSSRIASVSKQQKYVVA